MEPAELEALNVSRETVLARFDNLARAQTNKTAVELEKQTAEDEVKRVSLVNDLQQLDQTLQQLSDEQERLTLEGNQQIADLNSQLGPLESELGTLSNQIRSVRYDLQIQYNSLFYAQNADVDLRTNDLLLVRSNSRFGISIVFTSIRGKCRL